MNIKKYRKHLKVRCKNLTKKSQRMISKYDTASILLLVASMLVMVAYFALLSTAFDSWMKYACIGVSFVFLGSSIFFLFWRYSRRYERRVKSGISRSARIDVNTPANRIYTKMNHEEKEFYAKQSQKYCTTSIIFYILLYLILSATMFVLLFQVNSLETLTAEEAYPITYFFMTTGVAILLVGLLTTPLPLIRYSRLPNEDKIKWFIARNLIIFKAREDSK